MNVCIILNLICLFDDYCAVLKTDEMKNKKEFFFYD